MFAIQLNKASVVSSLFLKIPVHEVQTITRTRSKPAALAPGL